MSAAPLRSLDVEALVEALAAPAPAPSGGPAAALVGAMAASLVALVARASRDWPDGAGVAVQADGLRERLLQLADDDAEAFAAFLRELRSTDSGPARDARLGAALGRAADVPLAIAEAAADVVELSALAHERGRQDVAPDAAVARELAAGATRAAAALVEANLASRPEDARTTRAQRAVAAVGRR